MKHIILVCLIFTVALCSDSDDSEHKHSKSFLIFVSKILSAPTLTNVWLNVDFSIREKIEERHRERELKLYEERYGEIEQ